jgi:hypothetical protein
LARSGDGKTMLSAMLRARAMMGVAMILVLTLGYARYMSYATYTKAKG